MEKLLIKVSRLFFVGVIMILGVGVVCAMAWKIQSSEDRGRVAFDSMDNAKAAVMVDGAISGNDFASVSSEVVGSDARMEIIKRYLKKYNSPLLPYSELIFELSQTNGFEYYWILAIGQQESNL